MLTANSALLLTISMAYFPSLVVPVRCFCTTREGCDEEKHCDSRVCLVGIPHKEGSVVRSCQTGNDIKFSGSERCWSGAGSWDFVCACDSHYCNTYHFFRTQMADEDKGALEQSHWARRLKPLSRTIVVNRNQEKQTEMSRSTQDGGWPSLYGDPNRDLVSAILESPDSTDSMGAGSKGVGGGEGEGREEKGFHYLTVVLILVPLIVGAAAFCVVACNNYSSLW